ncbi:MAG: hypothetical protein IT226_04610 [Flavobacteriales bacterium]|nr:hypothetical protein [Flavobacteriales bacterium]
MLSLVASAQEPVALEKAYVIEGTFDTFTTDELGNVYALQGDELRLFDARGRSWLRNSTKTFGRIGTIDAFYSLKPMLFAPEQGQIAMLDNTLSLQGSVINLPRKGFPQVVQACMSVQNCFWFFDQQEMALIRVDNQLRRLAHTGRLDQVLGFTVEPLDLQELDARLYVNAGRKGILVFDLFGTYMKTIGITGARCMQVRDNAILFMDGTGIHRYDMRSFAIVDIATTHPAEEIRALRAEGSRVYLLLADRIEVLQAADADH